MPPSHPGHVCADCGKSYKAKETLTRHRKNHDAAPQYACHICTGAFRRRDLLSRHLAAHESKGDEALRVRRSNNSACERCIQRKMRCDGASPCEHCALALEQCTYPASYPEQHDQQDDDLVNESLALGGAVDPCASTNAVPLGATGHGHPHDNASHDWAGMDHLSLNADPMNIDTSWPWLYEQMYMQAASTWPGYAEPIPRLSHSPLSNRPQSLRNPRSGNDRVTPDALMQDYVEPHQQADDFHIERADNRIHTSVATQHSHITDATASSASPGNSPSHSSANTSVGTTAMSNQREEVSAKIVAASLKNAKDPSLGIWNKEQVSRELSQTFDFDELGIEPPLMLEHFVGLYFEHFYMLWPFLHRRTLQTIHRDSPYLYLTLSMVGAAYAGECAWTYHVTLLHTLRELLPAACFSESMPHHQLEYLTGSLMLLKISYMYFGHCRALSSIQIISAAMIYLIRRMDLLGTASLTGQLPLESPHRIGSRLWLRNENRKHLAVGMLMLENDVSILFGTRPLVSAEEFGISLPCQLELWTSEKDFSLSQLQGSEQELQPLLSQLVQLALDMDEGLPDLDPFGTMMVMHGLQAHVWRYSYEYGFASQQRAAVQGASCSRQLGEDILNTSQSASGTVTKPTKYAARTMKAFWNGRDSLMQALKRLRQALIANAQPEKETSQRTGLLGAHVLFHLSFMRLLAPLSAIHRLFLDTSQGNARPFTLQMVSTWACTKDATEALHHALWTRAVIYAELCRPKVDRARFNVLAQFGLFHGAALLWALSGASGENGPTVYDAVSGQSVRIGNESARKLLQSFAKLMCMTTLEWNGTTSLSTAVRDMSCVEYPENEQDLPSE